MRLNNILVKINEIYRISSWYYYLGFIFLGFSLRVLIEISLLKYIILGGFLLAYAYSFNDFYDQQQKRNFLIPLILVVISLYFFNPIEIIISLIFLFIVTIYSIDPIRLKAIPLACTLCNAIGFSLLFLLGYGILDFIHSLFFFLFFCFNMVAQLIHEVVHFKEDLNDRCKTTAIFLGKDKIEKISTIFLLIAIIISVYLFYMGTVGIIFLTSTTIFCLLFVHKIIKGINKNLRKIYRYTGVTLGLIYFLSFMV